MSKKMKSNILLFIVALIWGSAFVAQKSGMDLIEPFTFTGIRTFIGGVVLIPVVLLRRNQRKALADSDAVAAEVREVAGSANANRITFIGGLACGVVMFVAANFQQYGMVYTTAGKAGFITTMYVVLVPILALLTGKKVRTIMWLCVALGAVGIYLLCIPNLNELTLNKGDMLMMVCALIFAIHILVIDHFSPKVDGVMMSCVQFFVASVLSMICMFIFETPDIKAITDCAVPILYAGVLSCGVAYTLQILAQKHAEPTVASLILSFESVFAVIFGALLLSERMSGREFMGCVAIFAAVIIAQLPERKKQE